MSHYAHYVQHLPKSIRQNLAFSLTLVALIITLGVVVFRYSQNAPLQMVPLFANQQLRPADFDKIEAALLIAELNNYTIENGALLVPSSRRGKYLQTITSAKALPLGFDGSRDSVLDGSSIFESATQRRLRMQHALEKEIAGTILHFNGIEQATVRINQVTETGLRKKTLLSANVKIICSQDQPLDEMLVEKIRQAVSAHKAGLAPEKISVIDLRSDKIFPVDHSTAAGLARQNRLHEKSMIEHRWVRKIEQAIHFVPNAKVTVNSNLPTEATRTDQEPNDLSLAILVSVPKSYYMRLWKSQRDAINQRIGRANDEVQSLKRQTESKIEAAIRLICSTESVQPNLQMAQFDDFQPIVEPAWLVRMRHVHPGWIAVIAASLLVCIVTLMSRRSSGQSVPTESIPDVHILPVETAAQSSSEANLNDLTDDQLKEKLSNTVRTDPAAAARVLKNWMHKAG